MNIYVASLNYSTDSDSLKELFETYGEVSSANVITDRMTGRSRGFGFVEMPEDEAAKKAIEGLNGAEFAGRTITVNEARPKQDRNNGGYNSRRY